MCTPGMDPKDTPAHRQYTGTLAVFRHLHRHTPALHHPPSPTVADGGDCPTIATIATIATIPDDGLNIDCLMFIEPLPSLAGIAFGLSGSLQ